MERKPTSSRKLATQVCAILTVCLGVANADDSLARVKGARELVIAVDPNYPPMEFEERGVLKGFDIDIAKEVARALDVTPRFERLETTAIIAGLNSRQYDMVISAINITDDRKKQVDFIEYAKMSQVFVCHQSAIRVRGEAELKGKVVVVQADTTSHYWIKGLKEAVDPFLGTDAFQVKTFEDAQHCFEYLKTRRDCVVIADEPVGKFYAKHDSTFVVTGQALEPEPIGIAVHKQDQKLKREIERILDSFKATGRYHKIEEDWFDDELGRVAVGHQQNLFRFILQDVSPRILSGMYWTIILTLVSGLIGVLIGLAVSLTRMSSSWPAKTFASLYVVLFRGTPLLLQILFAFFAVPMLLGIRIDAFVAGTGALACNAGAYLSENFRSAIQSIEKGQMEAARALGMSHYQAMRYVIIPQTLRRLIPQLVNQLSALSKDTSLVMVIGVAEMLYETKRLASAFLRPEVYICASIGYLMIVAVLSWWASWLELKLEKRES